MTEREPGIRAEAFHTIPAFQHGYPKYNDGNLENVRVGWTEKYLLPSPQQASEAGSTGGEGFWGQDFARGIQSNFFFVLIIV